MFLKSFIKVLSMLLLLIIFLGSFVGCQSNEENKFEQLSDFEHAKIGVLTGSSQEIIAKERFPEAQLKYFTHPVDLVLALEQGKIDGYMLGSPFLPAARWEGANVKRVNEAVANGDIAFAFPKNASSNPLRTEFNTFLQQVKSDGTVQNLQEKWFSDNEPTEHPNYSALSGENGVIRLAVVAQNKPLIYQYNNQISGIEMELLTLFAKQYGYRFQIEIVPFDSIIMGMATGKYDMASSGLQVTPERSESVNFSDPYMQFDVVMVVKDEGAQQPMTLADIENATIGIVTGTNWDMVAQSKFPNAKRKYYISTVDAVLALQQGKIDTFFADKSVSVGLQWENTFLDCIDEPLVPISNALILAKNGYDENLLKQLNEYIEKSKSNGSLDLLSEKWFNDTEPTEHPDYSSLPDKIGTLKIAISDSMKPNSYQKGNIYTGYEVDFLTIFAREYGYALEITGMNFDALIPSVTSGKCDIGACGITITPERMESVTFTNSHYETYGVAVTRKDDNNTVESQKTVEDINTVGVMTGTVWDNVAKKSVPNADIKYFSTTTDLLLALEQGKVDGLLGPKTFYTTARWENVPASLLNETFGSISSGFILAKDEYNKKLYEQLNEFIIQAKKTRLTTSLEEKWIGTSEPKEHPDYKSLTGENGTLTVAVDQTAKPMVYRKSDLYTGYDVEFLTEFAHSYGYRLEFIGMSFDALLPYVSAGKCDLGACGVGITPERKESVTFTDSYLEIDGVMIVGKNENTVAHVNIFDQISESFEKTFIREERWKLIVSGIGVTMLISICSAIAGTILGFLLYLLTRSDVPLIRKITGSIAKIYSRLIAGTPVVVILMILFYIVFSSVEDMSGIIVSIIGFTLIFGAFVYEHMKVCVNGIDRGQTEAAYALGYTKSKAFFRVVLPQAMKMFLPAYSSHTVELIKATAVVGYIAVNDLTKMSDIIRSNTYDAFFPLISTAIIYFILTWILSLLLKLVVLRFEPKRRKKEEILKGVKII